MNALTAAFDEMARREGFDDSTAFYADDATFEDELTTVSLTTKALTGKNWNLTTTMKTISLILGEMMI